MILSCLTTANNRLAIAAAEITPRIVNLSNAEVFVMVCLETFGIEYATAILGRGWTGWRGKGKEEEQRRRKMKQVE
jgi:hypothetical protein